MKKQNIIQIIVAVLALLLMIGAVSMILGDLDLGTNSGSGGAGAGTNDQTTNDETTSVETVDRSEGDVLCAHSYDKGTIEKDATCKAEGLIVYTCTKCGKTVENVLEISADHTYEGLKKYNENQHVSICSVCGDAEYSDHVLSELKIAATCESNGSIVYDCVCGYKSSVTIPKLGHVVSTWSKASGDSTNHYGLCTRDGCAARVAQTHNYGAESVVTSATCTESGLKKKTCSVCGYEKTTTIFATGHNLSLDSMTQATCETAGSKRYVCQNSGCSYSETEAIPAVGHSFAIEAGGSGSSSHVLYCIHSGCDYSESVSHSLVVGSSIDANYHSAHCSVCGASSQQSHSLTLVREYVSTGQRRWETWACSACGYSFDKLADPYDLGD